MEKKIIIAIDGPSSTGKSILAKQLAKNLNYIHIDTGAMYRAISLFAIKKGFFKKKIFDKKKLLSSLKDINISYQLDSFSEFNKIQLNGKEVEKDIRTMKVSENVSYIAKIPEIRKKLVFFQQKLGKKKGLVIDGRDIGTVVFPKAELKIFLNAPLSIRAYRRYKEIYRKNSNITYNQVFNNLLLRDNNDFYRKISPLKKAKDAIEIDNSLLSLDQQFFIIFKIVKKILDYK